MVCGARSMSLPSHGPNIAAPNRARDDECFFRLPRSPWLSSVVSRFTLHAPPFLVPSESRDMYFRQHNAPRKRARSKTKGASICTSTDLQRGQADRVDLQ